MDSTGERGILGKGIRSVLLKIPPLGRNSGISLEFSRFQWIVPLVEKLGGFVPFSVDVGSAVPVMLGLACKREKGIPAYLKTWGIPFLGRQPLGKPNLGRLGENLLLSVLMWRGHFANANHASKNRWVSHTLLDLTLLMSAFWGLPAMLFFFLPPGREDLSLTISVPFVGIWVLLFALNRKNLAFRGMHLPPVLSKIIRLSSRNPFHPR